MRPEAFKHDKCTSFVLEVATFRAESNATKLLSHVNAAVKCFGLGHVSLESRVNNLFCAATTTSPAHNTNNIAIMALPSTQAPREEYAGDEINALVLDCGSYSTRAGFAGEDAPKSVVPTHYGSLPSGDRLFGENAIHLPRPDMEIRNPFNADGIVEDWETASKLWEYAITSRLTGAKSTPPSKNGLNDAKDENGDVAMDEGADSHDENALSEYPLMMTEAPWNPIKAREKTMEIAMEEWNVPAFFLAKNGQLAA